jgi:hypothetical protein
MTLNVTIHQQAEFWNKGERELIILNYELHVVEYQRPYKIFFIYNVNETSDKAGRFVKIPSHSTPAVAMIH